MQKHRKHIRRWPKLASLVAAGASLLGLMIVVPARAVPTDPTPSCNGAICTLSFEVSDEPYHWQASAEVGQVWLDVQGATGPGGEPLHWKGQLLNSQWPLQIEHLPNGLIAIRSYPPGPGEFVYAAPSGWNQSWVNDQAFARVDLIPAVDDADGIATITTISSPRVTSFNIAAGSGDISAHGAIEFSEPVTGLDPTDFVIWNSGHGCNFENIQPTTQSSFTFEMTGCLSERVAVNLVPMSVQGTLSGPRTWWFGSEIAVNVSNSVSTAVQTPSPTPSPTASIHPSASPTPIATAEPGPVATQDPVPIAEVAVPVADAVVQLADQVVPAVEPVEPFVDQVASVEAEQAADREAEALMQPEPVATASQQPEPTATEEAQILPQDTASSSGPREGFVATREGAGPETAEPEAAGSEAAPVTVATAATAATATGIAAALATACWLVLKLVRKLRANPTRRPQIRLRAIGAS